MELLIGIIFTLVVICSILLIGIVMIQQGKSGGGVSALGGGGMTDSILGTAAGNVITKTTTTLAIIFIGLTFVLAILVSKSNKDSSTMVERYENAQQSPIEEAVEDAVEEEAADVQEMTEDITEPAMTDEDISLATEVQDTVENSNTENTSTTAE